MIFPIQIFRSTHSRKLIQGSAVVLLGSMTANICAYLYHLLMGRILGPSGYGELSSLISILYIFGVPISVLQTTITKYFSICKAGNDSGNAKDLYIRTISALIIFIIIFFAVFIVISPAIGKFLNLTDPRLLLWTSITFAFLLFSSVNISVLQGFQLFIWYSIFSAIPVVLKLFISIPLAYRGVESVVIGGVIATILTYVLLFYPIRFLLKKQRGVFSISLRAVLSFAGPTFFALLGYTLLYSTDIIFVRHFLSGQESGIYSAIATLGKIIFYASSAVVVVLFPVLSERTEKAQSSGKVLGLALGIVGVISLTVTVLYFCFPVFVVSLLYGSLYVGASKYLGYFALFMSLYSIGNVFVLGLLALNKLYIWTIAIGTACLQAFLISLFHQSIMQVISINIIVSLVFVCSASLYYLYTIKKLR